MDTILNDLLNTVAPLVVQILAAVVLAIVSALLLKGKQFVEGRLNAQQRELLRDLAKTAVYFAEKEGQAYLGKAGDEKARIAQKYLESELRAAGITTVVGYDFRAAIVGVVQRAWADCIGPTYRPDGTSNPETPADSPVAQPAQSPPPAPTLVAQSS